MHRLSRIRSGLTASSIRMGIAIALLTAMPGLLNPCTAYAEPAAPVQVFDVLQEQVVATLPNSPDFREQADRWLHAVQRLSGRARLEAERGLVIHIPLSPPLPVYHSWLTINASELYLFIDPQEKENPHLLIFSSEGKPYVFDGPEDPEPFLKQHKLLAFFKNSQANTSNAEK